MNTSNAPADPGFDEVCSFIIKLGEAAHGYGSTAARLEVFLSRVIRAFGYSGVFRSTPTEIVFAFQRSPDQDQQVHISSLPGTGLDLAKLARLGDLVNAVTDKKVSITQATAKMSAIDKTAPQWGLLAVALSYAFCGAGLAVLFSGSWWDVLLSTLLSVLVFGMVVLSARQGRIAGEWLPLTSAFAAAVLATLVRIYIPELNIVLVTLASVVILLPGYPISLGLIELVSRHVVSGMANLMNGMVYLVKQFMGAWLGYALVSLLLTVPEHSAGVAVNAQWLWLFMPLLILALCVAFQTSIRDLLPACLGCLIAYGGILLGSELAGANLGNLIGTIIAVMFANLWTRKTGRPTSIVLLPAIILLVSGSIGFRGLASIAAGQTAIGEHQFLQMFIVALTIAAGILVGNTLLRPRATL